MAIEVGSAYLSIGASTKGLSRDVYKELGSVEKQASKSSKSMGSSLGGNIKNGLKTGVLAVGGLATAVTGLAVTGGINRALKIENARASLKGLGHDTKAIDTIMGNALASVKGTAFGLGDAASIAASAVAAGVKPGQDLERTLKLVSDAATIAGVGLGSMGAIFNKAAAANKVQMDVINQLHDAGVPALSLLAKQMGVTAEEASKMASKGKIDFSTFQDAMEAGLGGAALESGSTFTGAFANMRAAAGRLGEKLVGGVLPQLTTFFGQAIVWADALAPHAQKVGEVISTAFQVAGSWIQTSLIPALQSAWTWFSINLLPVLRLFGAFILATVVPAVVSLATWIKNNVAWLMPLAAVVAGVVASYMAYVKVSAILKTALAAARAAQFGLNAVMALNPIGLVVAAIAALVAGLVWFFTKTETGKKVWEKVWSGIQKGFGAFVAWIKPILADIISAWQVTWERIKKVWAVVGPPLIAVIKAQLDHMKVIFMAVFNVIKAVVSAVFNQIKTVIKTAMGVIQGVIKTVTSLIKGDWEGAWDGIKQTFSAFINGIQDIARGAISGMLNIGGSIIDGLKRGIESGFGKIKDGLNWLTDKIPDWKGPKKRDKTLLTPAGKSIMQGFLKGLESGYAAVKDSLTGLTESLVKWQEQAIKKEADRLIEARRQANRKIDKYNKSRAKGQKKKDKLPSLTRAEAEKQAKKNVGVSSKAMKTAEKLVGAQSKTTKGIWDDGKYKGDVKRWQGMNAGTTNLLSSLTKNGNWRKSASDELRGATLADIGKAQDQVSKALSAAKETLASLKEARAQLKEQIASSIRGELDLTAAIQPAVEASVQTIQRSDGKGNIWHETKNIAGTAAKATFASVAGNVKAMAAKAKKFAQKLQALVKKGIPEGLVQEVAGLGTENGIAVADALLSGSASQVKELSADYASLNSWSSKAGDYVAGQMYDTGIFAAEGLIKGLEADTKKLEAAATKIADKLVKAVNKALGVASPAKEFIKTGKWSMKGLQVGMEDTYGSVESSLSKFSGGLPNAVSGLEAGMDSRAFGSGMAVYVQNPFTGEYLLAQVADIADHRMKHMVSTGARGY